VIQVVVGLTGLFLFLSLVVSHVVEIFSAFVGRRGNHLADGVRDLLGQVTGDAVLNHPLIKGLRFPAGRLPSYIPSSLFAEALIDVVTKVGAGEAATVGAQAAGIANHIWQVGKASGGAAAQVQVERWFDAAMGRLSGAYKRHTQGWMFGMGAILVVALNANAVGISQALWREPIVRQAAAKAAEKELERCSAAAGGAIACADLPSFGALPLGWGKLPGSRTDWVVAALGWLLSTIAVSFGAPFWFDILKRAVPSIRLAGPPGDPPAAAPARPPNAG
jgi:hypothetical protein